MTKKSTLSPDTAGYRKVVPAGDYWIHKVRAGQIFRIVDLEGNQAADTLFYSAADPAERYSAVGTIREQRNVYLGLSWGRHQADVHGRQPDAGDRRRHGRPSRHAGRGLLHREQHC